MKTTIYKNKIFILILIILIIIDCHTATTKEKIVLVNMPIDNIIRTKDITGYFPIHRYVFFDKGHSEIPKRYIKLFKAEAFNFKEANLQDFMKGDMTIKETYINQLMTTYYNILNIYADRMRKNPNELLTLKATNTEENDNEKCANNIKKYLVDNYSINSNRISIVTEKPQIISGTIYTNPRYNKLIDEENRRVEFVFTNPEMSNPLKYTIRDESSIDNYMIFSIRKNIEFARWDVKISGEFRSLYFGPFLTYSERVNPAEIMRFLESGKFNAKVSLKDKYGNRTEENIKFNLLKDKEVKIASRYLMLFNYNSSDPIISYENKIKNNIAPKIINESKVIIHGHTDNIGSPAECQLLSQQRADEVKNILDAIFIEEKKDIKVQAFGIGQTKMQYTFDNKLPEGRMYNRNIFIEIINQK